MSDAHDRWVVKGKCPVVSLTKAWCALSVGHSGPHHSPRVPHRHELISERNPIGVDWQQ